MKIELSLIKPSPHPVRTSWDEKKMDELAQSIREQGLIVPVKVRPVGSEYELVYGHRRVEASRRAGLNGIEAIIEGMEDPDALIQALIENLQREDLGPMDTARGLKVLQDATGWSSREIGRRGIMERSYSTFFLALLTEPEEIQNKVGEASDDSVATPITEMHVREVRHAGLADADRIAVINKAADERLTSRQTRHVADALAQAPNETVRKRILEIPVARTPELWGERVRAETHIAEEKEAMWWDNYRDTKGFVEQIARTKRLFLTAWESVERDQIAPEHMPYLRERMRQLHELLGKMMRQLDDKRIEAIGG